MTNQNELNQDHILQVKYPDVPVNDADDFSAMLNSEAYQSDAVMVEELKKILEKQSSIITQLREENRDLRERMFLHHKSLPTFY